MKKCAIILTIFMASVSAAAGEWDMSDWGNSGNPIEISEPEVAKPAPEKPMDYPADFHVNDFNDKPWLRDFEVLVVVNKATSGREAQTVRAYINGKVVRLHEVLEFEQALNNQETDPEKSAERSRRIQELSSMIKNNDDTLFLASTGRDQFERKGEHHSQKDSWTVTPTGYYPMQHMTVRHKSESYSSSGCDSIVGKFLGAILRKQLCTYMEHAMFFNRGIALHKAIPGTERALGKKASGGCVRLPAALAEYLYLNIQKTRQPKQTKIPLINVDGTPVLNEAGQVQYSIMAPTAWGKLYAWSALVIVTDKIIN